MSDSNVIKFPVKFKGEPPKAEEVFHNLMAMKEEEIETTTEIIFTSIVDILEAAGFYDETDKTKLKDMLLVLESVRALMAKDYGIDHPFHDLAENAFSFLDESGQQIKFNNPQFRFATEDEIDLSS